MISGRRTTTEGIGVAVGVGVLVDRGAVVGLGITVGAGSTVGAPVGVTARFWAGLHPANKAAAAASLI
jgi:UDP-3-O-[3-hydroxymyristoyl] glucosamine N-acyltransferase